jgi:serine/threonine protein phosphatase PrpC
MDVGAVAGAPRESLPSRSFTVYRPQPSRLQHVPHHPTVVGLTDVGQTRSRNEDSLSLLPHLGVAVVADGMGGHPGGDVASRIAAETAVKALEGELGDGASRAGDPAARLQEAMLRSVLQAHEAIRVEGQKDPELVGMGTTITALAVDRQTDAFVLGHVGDSRAYRFRDGDLTQLTRDDTWVQERIDAQQLTVEQGKRHPFAHLLTQCLGLEDTPVPHITPGSVEIGDVYLLCSDGLVGMVDDPTLAEILVREFGANGTSSEAARGEPVLKALVDAANAAGGYDNITAVLMSIGAVGD